jgi:hypothetical protein
MCLAKRAHELDGRAMNQERNLATSLSVLTGVTLMFGGLEPVSAATIGYSTPFSLSQPLTGSPGTPAQTTTQSLDLFNPALGTLTAVKMILESETNTTARIEVGNPLIASGSAIAASSFSINLVTPIADSLVFAGAAQSTSCSAPSFCMAENSAGGALDSMITRAAWVPLFSGLGTLDVRFDLFLKVNGECNEGHEGCLPRASASWSGTFTVEYTYNPVNGTEVPEPASAALLGGGLAALVALRRRRQG